MMGRDRLLSKRAFCWAKSLIVAAAFSAAVWDSGPFARVAINTIDVSYTQDAGPQSNDPARNAFSWSRWFSPDEWDGEPAPISAEPATPDGTNSDPDTAQASEDICSALDRSAADNDLPIEFFTRLIWQESRFNPRSVSHAGAQGIAQFMPETAHSRGLFDPFDPLKAIPKSAELLRDLVGQFGNLGLAAAAYNAGPGRIVQWLVGRKSLPKETQDYVRIITGRPAEDWTSAEPTGSDPALKTLPSCDSLLAIAQAEGRARKAATPKPPTIRLAMIAMRSTQQRHGSQAKAQAKAARRVVAQRPARVTEARDAHAQSRPRLNLVAERARAGRPKRLAHSM